jgi:hypothetical protein
MVADNSLTFRESLARAQPLRDLCSLVCVHRATQGVFVEPSDLWRMAWMLKCQERTDVEIEQVVKALRDALSGTRPERTRQVLKDAAVPYPFTSDPAYDFEWYPQWLRQIVGGQLPLTVHIHVCQRSLPRLEFDRQRRDVQGISRRFLRFFAVAIEERNPAVLGALPGSHAFGAVEGTLGGYLCDPHGRVFGVTCAHVAPLGVSVTDGRGALLGNVVHDSTLLPNSAGRLCDPTSATLNRVDASLFTASSTRVRSRCGAPQPRSGAGQTVQMTGAQSKGPHNYYLGGLALTQTLVYQGRDFCFAGLTTIRARPMVPLPDAPEHELAPAPVAGDSGAWIHTVAGSATSKPGWIGMLVGTDGVDGYALDASDILTWAAEATGTKLSVW